MFCHPLPVFLRAANPPDGDRAGVELTVLGKRRIQYEEELAYDGTNYDAWFSLARLEEDAYRADKEDGEDVEPTRVREVYERAVANVPPATEKRWVLRRGAIHNILMRQILATVYSTFPFRFGIPAADMPLLSTNSIVS